MRVRYLDLQTGETRDEDGLSEFALTDGNWSCDCNRSCYSELIMIVAAAASGSLLLMSKQRKATSRFASMM